jgi:hypothetical protein
VRYEGRSALVQAFRGLEFVEKAFPLRTHDPSAANRTATLTGDGRCQLAGRGPQAHPFELVSAPMLQHRHASTTA